MGYKNATQILPQELLEKVQNYIDGEYLYIPRIPDNKKSWGSKTAIRQELLERNAEIYADYLAGFKMESLAKKYYLSLKSIERIVRKLKNDSSR